MKDLERIKAWFLGPKAENQEFLSGLISQLLELHFRFREMAHPTDGIIISPDDQKSPRFLEEQRKIASLVEQLSEMLNGSTFFATPRYMGHMNSDILIPGIVGYLVAMLHNQNNVAQESSPVTTHLESEVVGQFATLAGFDPNAAWGHITSGGTAANLEALWTARNLKYLPLAAREVAREFEINIGVLLPDGHHRPLVKGEADADDDWELLNLRPAVALRIIEHLERAFAKKARRCQKNWDSRDQLQSAVLTRLKEIDIRALGSWGANRRFPPGVLLVGANHHYSIKKIADVLGIGQSNIKLVDLDRNFRMDMRGFEQALIHCERERMPIIAVVCTAGSTEQGAFDPIDSVVTQTLALRKIAFFIHIDGAYGAYARTLVLPEPSGSLSRFVPRSKVFDRYRWPTEEVYNSLRAIQHADSMTVDPHKLGYVPYPAGVVIYRNRALRKLIDYEPPYISSTEEPSIGYCSLEGSRAGAVAAAIWACHKIIPLTREGYGALIGRSLIGTRLVYELIRDMGIIDVDGSIRLLVRPLTQDALPDFNILCFAFNVYGNEDLKLMNNLNYKVWERFAGGHSEPQSFCLTKTEMDLKQYGKSLHPFLRALGFSSTRIAELESSTGVKPANPRRVLVLRITLMHPWYSLESEPSDFIGGENGLLAQFKEELVRTLKSAAITSMLGRS